MFEINEDAPEGGQDRGSALIPAGGGVSTLARAGESGGYGLASYGPTSSAASRHGFSLRSMLRYKWMVLGITLAGVAVSVPPVWMLIKPKYYANTLIQLKPTMQRQIYKIEETGVMPLYQQFVNTNVMLIRGAGVLNPVLNDPEVLKTSWYRDPPQTLLSSAVKPAYERLLEDLNVVNVKGTELIEIGFYATDPKDAELIVKTIQQVYLDQTKGTADQRTRDLQQRLQEEEGRLKNTLTSLISTRGSFTGKFGSASLEDVQTLHNSERLKLQGELRSLETTIKMYDWEREYLRQIVEGATPEEADAATDGMSASASVGVDEGGKAGAGVPEGERPRRLFWSDREWSRLYQDRESKRTTLETALESNMGENHPRMREMKAALELAEASLRQREEALLAGGEPAVAAGAVSDGSLDPATRLKELDYLAKRGGEQAKLLRDMITTLEKQITDIAGAASELKMQDHEIEHITLKYAAVQKRVEEIQSELISGPARIEPAGQVKVSSRPKNDRRPLFSGVLVFGWLAAGLALAYFRAAMDPSMSEVSDVTNTVQVPFLGQMPRFAPGTDALSDTSPMLQESIRMIRTALLERCSVRQGYTVLITSPNVGTGKTTFAMLLARSLAHVGKRVLLVDTDIRRSSLSQRVNAGPRKGLVDYLRTGKLMTKDVTFHADVLGVDVIPAGDRASVDDAERMANGRFGQALKEWRGSYDFVILDSAPVLPVADARILAGQADGTIMAVRASQTRRAEAMEALAELSAAGARLFGTVLIGTDPRGGYYRGYDYGSLARRPVEVSGV
ncbi:MAG: hypothetical protein BroJett003_23630 [Planctomycetota bacterium]|nr:MAG: hypothetical protein BroJett003_23630 [Planctomycetota bacterium]